MRTGKRVNQVHVKDEIEQRFRQKIVHFLKKVWNSYHEACFEMWRTVISDPWGPGEVKLEMPATARANYYITDSPFLRPSQLVTFQGIYNIKTC